jgi:uncharacterized protein
MNNHPLSPRSQEAATGLLAAVDGAQCVLVATADGFALAHAQRRPTDADRLAALVSSIGALGDAASSECHIGSPRCLVVEGTEGRMVIRCFRAGAHAIALAVLTDASVTLGLVWTQLAQAERLLVAA